MLRILSIILLTLLLTPIISAEDDVDYAKPEILVDTNWVAENMGAENVRLVHIGGSLGEYKAAHIPGALFITLSDLDDPDNPIPDEIGTPEQISAALSSLGINAEDTIVLYDSADNLLAARAFWVLKYYQHQNVVIYNGGTKKWEADGLEFAEGDPPEVEPSTYEIAEADPEIRTSSEYVLDHLDDAGVQLCDARSAGEYDGTRVTADRGGHIPGAINLEWVDTVNADDGTFKSFTELDDLFTAAGFDRDKQIITYCQIGVRGAHVWFVLRELLGYPDVRLYDGSWVEYGNNDTFPIEN